MASSGARAFGGGSGCVSRCPATAVSQGRYRTGHCRALEGSTCVGRCREQLSSNSAGAAFEAVLQMQYSMTFIRLVNGVADSAQKGKVASSVANLAGYAGE